jgi:leucyl aminopeptidase (aminopeptidase T)
MDLDSAVHAVVATCLGVKPDENVVVVADDGTRAIGEALHAAAAAAGADAVLTIMSARANHGEEPPAPVAAALAACDVFIAPTTSSISHTRARRAASDAGVRGATLPGVTADLLARLMTADLPTLKRRSQRLAELLTEAREAHFTCPRGSDFRLDLCGRDGIPDDGDLRAPGAFGNLPCGEGFIAPLGGEGTIVVASIGGIEGSGETTLTVEDGRLTAGEPLLSKLLSAGELGTNLAELGIGTNEKAALGGNILEDEKILGTVHVAFGASAAMGGTVSVPIHIDSVVLEPTLTVGGTPVIEAGRFLL